MPTTFCLAVSGNLTPYMVSQNLAISGSVLGSCAPKSLDGTPSTTSPFGPYVSCNFSRSAYCGVNPQYDATLTTSTGLPAKSFMSSGLLSMVVEGELCADAIFR